MTPRDVIKRLSSLPIFRDDVAFIIDCIERMPPSAHDWAFTKYEEKWRDAADGQPAHKAANAGARAANYFLLQVLKAKGLK